MQKRFLIVSDIEMGKNDVMDDFSDDHVFAHFVEKILEKDKGDEEVFLLLNGDIFDFLKMDFRGEHTRYITEDVSLWKLENIFDAHPVMFEALRAFLQKESHKIIFIIGNHDFDLIWPKVQGKIAGHLGKKSQVGFTYSFDYEKLHVEHGNMLDPFFCNDVKKPFVSHKGQKVLNLPVGAYVFFSELAPVKRKFAKEEQFYPREKIADFYPEYGVEITKVIKRYFWKGVMEPWIHLADPTYRINYLPFIKHVLTFGLDFINDERFLPSRLNSLRRRHPKKEVFVTGHAHLFKNVAFQKQRFFVTDTWRNEYDLLREGNPKKAKTYAELLFDNENLMQSDLHVFDFNEIPREHRTVEMADIELKKTVFEKLPKL
ncbi:MAG: hypothetical protein WC843_05175 [Candidatus Gracilibacteria bacterium]|jgi:UDP-2,3-diacylglucosamine pyrophosphatase LpxH